MNILITGCGRIGAQLAAALDRRGHDVSVIDRDANSFDILPADFGGFTTQGVPIDSDALKRAGAETCDALYAATDSDDMNIMVCELVRELFGVKRVFALTLDGGKGAVFEPLGIDVICPASLAVASACAAIEPEQGADALICGQSVHFTVMDTPEELVGKTPADITYEPSESLFGVIRGGAGLETYTGQHMEFGARDKLVFATLS